MKPSEMAMMRAVARMPRTGCLRPDKGSPFMPPADLGRAAAMLRSRLAILSQVARLMRPEFSKIVESHAHDQTHPLPARFLGRRNGRHPIRSRTGKPVSRQSYGAERGASGLGYAARPDSAACGLGSGGAAERAARALGPAGDRWPGVATGAANVAGRSGGEDRRIHARQRGWIW